MSYEVDYTPTFKNPFGTTVTWSVYAGALPAGVELDPATGRVFGSADETIENVVLMVTDGVHKAFTGKFRVGPLGPVMDGLTHWSRADDGLLTDGVSGNEYLDDRSGFTYVASGTQKAVFNATADVLVPNVLNGKSGLRLTDNNNQALRNFPDMGNSAHVSNIFGAAFTLQFLWKIENSNAAFHSIAGVGGAVHIATDGTPEIIRARDLAGSGYHTLYDNTVKAPHLITVTHDGTTMRWYLDDDFDTPLASFSFDESGNAASPALEWFSASFDTLIFETLTYSRVLSTEELTQNLTYLSSAARWGNTWL